MELVNPNLELLSLVCWLDQELPPFIGHQTIIVTPTLENYSFRSQRFKKKKGLICFPRERHLCHSLNEFWSKELYFNQW